MKETQEVKTMKEIMKRCIKVCFVAMFATVFLIAIPVSVKAEDVSENMITINPNTTVEDSLKTADDVHYYEFEVDKTGYMNIRFQLKEETTLFFGCKVTLLISDGRDGFTTIVQRNIENKTEFPICNFKKGTKMYLKVEAANYTILTKDGTIQYDFTVNTTESDNWEQESNDTLKTATTIPFGKSYNGNLYRNGDIDFYTFKITSNGFVNIKFMPIDPNVPEDSLKRGYDVSVYQSTEQLCKVNFCNIGNHKIYLKKGTYYIKVEKNAYDYAPTLFKTYTMKTSFKTFAKPEKAVFKTVKAASRDRINIRLKKVTNATGYQIDYSTKKIMKGKKSVFLTTTKGEISNLIAKKTYYIRVRAYMETVDGKKVYGTWSKIKKVK